MMLDNEREVFDMDNRFSCDIKKELAVLKESGGYKRALRVISWNYYDPKLDLREWSPEGHSTKRGFTLTDEEAHILLDALTEYFKDKETPAEKEEPAEETAEDLPF